MGATFEVYQDKAGEYRFRLKAGNGEVVASGEGYPTLQGVRSGIDAVKRAAADADVDETGLSDGGASNVDQGITNMRGRDTE